MKIIVPIKWVPETTVKPKVASDGKSLDLSSVKFVVNPFDEFAIEEALQRTESAGGGEVTVVTVGGDDDVQALRQALAMGAGNAVRINDEGRAGLGDHAVAALLAAWIRKQEYDLILCGKHAVGSDSNQVPQMLGAMLGLPVMTSITKLEIADGTATGQRAIEGKTEVVTVKLPAVISCDKGLNEPRYPKLKGIMAAKRAKIEEFTAAALGVDDSVLASSSLELESIELPPEKGAGVKVEVGDDPDAAVEKFIEWLKNEAQAL